MQKSLMPMSSVPFRCMEEEVCRKSNRIYYRQCNLRQLTCLHESVQFAASEMSDVILHVHHLWSTSGQDMWLSKHREFMCLLSVCFFHTWPLCVGYDDALLSKGLYNGKGWAKHIGWLYNLTYVMFIDLVTFSAFNTSGR